VNEYRRHKRSLCSVGFGAVLYWTALFTGLFAFAQRPHAARFGDQSGNVQYGPPIPIGNGFARAYLKYADSQLVEAGVSLTPGVMEGQSVSEEKRRAQEVTFRGMFGSVDSQHPPAPSEEP
jgi:hypothetical protein